jgi:YidC/Oxa1 family membrane protein insertase
MIDFLYNIIIFPLVQIIEISFVIVYRIFGNRALAIIGVSAVFTVCTMPLYFIAEKWQQVERELQNKLKPKVDKIKSVFKGDEQYMVISTYYRQNHYHPLYALRNSFGLLIQIPFFIAAYSYLSHLDFIKGSSFLFIHDLGAPDGSLSLGRFSLNILPILMTLINCVSGAVYTKGLPSRDKIQVFGIAFVFLILLYNSPAGLVLYWTMNNIFSLLKNILTKTGHGLKIVYLFLCLCALSIFIYYIPLGLSPKRLFVAGLFSLFIFTPLFIKLFRLIKNKITNIISLEQSSLSEKRTYILSTLIFFVLCGLVIPGALIASSVQEFSFLDSYTSPLPFLYTVSVQAMGIFLFWPLCIYFIFPQKIRYGLCLVLSLLCITALVNNFLFPGDYGFITTTLRFSNPDTFESKYVSIIINAIITLGIIIIFSILIFSKRKIVFYSFQMIILSSLVVFSIINIYNINRDFNKYDLFLKESSTDASSLDKLTPVYHLSKTGKNTVVIMLDAAISGYVPYIFDEKPELLQAFSGFTYYPNCVSFGSHTRIGAPLIFGGYEYEPKNIQKHRSYAMGKHNEALLMMPRIFSKENYRVTVTDPSFANYSLKPDLSIFKPYPEISVQNTQGNYTGMWLQSHPELKIVSIPELLRELLTRFSFLKISSPAFRVFIYDKARWLKPKDNISNNQLTLDTLDCYTTLDYLPLLTEITDDAVNTYTSIVNDLTHDSAIFQYPDYIPVMEITNMGDGPFAEENSYHSNVAAFLLLGKWLNFLRKQEVYDNTRIVIVSDHGRSVGANYSGNISLPDGSRLASYHALLLVKDFNARGNPVTDTTFMTHADVPDIVMEGLIDNPQNPFSGNIIKSNKENGISITTAGALQFMIAEGQWLHVSNNIFDPDNWERINVK